MNRYKAHFLDVKGLSETELHVLSLSAATASEAFEEAIATSALNDFGANTVDICEGTIVIDRIRIGMKPTAAT